MEFDDTLDNALVEKVKAGDIRAFEVLVLRYQYRIIYTISNIVRDPTEALDIAQEAFFRAYHGIHKFRGEANFYTWLHRIAVNTANQALSNSKRLPAMNGADPGENHLPEAATTGDTPERILIKEEVESIILKALDTMPGDLSITLQLREIDGLSYDEIAEKLGCPIGTVRSRISRAREYIDNVLKKLV